MLDFLKCVALVVVILFVGVTAYCVLIVAVLAWAERVFDFLGACAERIRAGTDHWFARR